MEEDINIIENYKDMNLDDFNYNERQVKQAIENLIARYKELEEETRKPLKVCIGRRNYGKTCEIKTFIEEDYIPKSKVREKIKELEKEADYKSIDNPTGRIHFHKEPCDYQIQVLQELL